MFVPDAVSPDLSRIRDLLPRIELARLPTPLTEHSASFAGGRRRLSIKHDEVSSMLYGGNKVRKLEYILPKATAKCCRRIATFGAVGSHHALATAMFAQEAGLPCTCFLSHQPRSPQVAITLNMHLRIGTELVRYGGSYRSRMQILREHLWGRHAWVVPMGGSSWHGTVAFVAAGLELAGQLAISDIPVPDRLYVGTGTMGTAAGIGLGLALAKLPTEVHAVRVSDRSITNEHALRRLVAKTAQMMRRIDASIPADIAERVNIRIRDEFFGPGYAQGTDATDRAIAWAQDELGLNLETTYTGKAMSALLADLDQPGSADLKVLYWHTYNFAALDVPHDRPLDDARLPEEFRRYFA